MQASRRKQRFKPFLWEVEDGYNFSFSKQKHIEGRKMKQDQNTAQNSLILSPSNSCNCGSVKPESFDNSSQPEWTVEFSTTSNKYCKLQWETKMKNMWGWIMFILEKLQKKVKKKKKTSQFKTFG